MGTVTGVLFTIGFVALVIGYFIRVAIFNAMDSDRVAAEFLEDTSVLSFGDFLWIHLYRKRDQIDRQFKPRVLLYFWLTLSAVISWAAMFSIHWLAA